MLVFTLRFTWKPALAFKINARGISPQQIVYSENLEWNLYPACYPWLMHYDWKLSVWKWRKYIHTFGWHTIYFITFISVSVTWCHRWHSGPSWHSGWRCSQIWWRFARFFLPPACLQILCCAILAWKAASRMIFINHCRVSFYCSLQVFLPRKLNCLHLLFWDFHARILN